MKNPNSNLSKLIAIRAEIELMRVKKEEAERACAAFYEIKDAIEKTETEAYNYVYEKETPTVTPDLNATSNWDATLLRLSDW